MPSELRVDNINSTTSPYDPVFSTTGGALSHRNIIINGDFRINQRGNHTGKTAEEKQIAGDRWTLNVSSLGTWSGGTEADAPTGSGFRNSGYLNCTSAASSPSSGAYCQLQQRFEGQDLQLIRKGTSSAKPVTLSFWVKSPKTGIHICELYDGDNSRHCSQSYTIGTANTWEYKSVTFPADTTGAFGDDNNLSLYVTWWIAAGSNFTSGTLQTTWGTTAANRAVGQVNVADAVHSSNNYWQITGVQLELGTVATPFEHRSFAEELRRCMRYYTVLGSIIGTGYQNGSNQLIVPLGDAGVKSPTNSGSCAIGCVPFRTSPTISGTLGTASFANHSGTAEFTSNTLSTIQASTTGTMTLTASATFNTNGQNDNSSMTCYYNGKTLNCDAEL